jgi:hypothetical protein
MPAQSTSEAPSNEASGESVAQREAMRAILLGVHNYVSVYNKFPTQPNDGHSAKLSWLVRILPYLGETDLANRFDLTQAWDNQQNLALLDIMPKMFGRGRQTNFRWVESDVVQFQDITDGTSNTIACIFGGQSVYWTENRPMSVVEALDLFLALPQDAVMIVGMYDGSVKLIGPKLPVDDFKAMLTPQGGEVISYTEASH